MKPRVFIMGFPGSGQTGNLNDLDAEKSYGRWAVHMNTVAGNEMLVLDAAKRYPDASFFGLNPGFISTNICSNLLGLRSADTGDNIRDGAEALIIRSGSAPEAKPLQTN